MKGIYFGQSSSSVLAAPTIRLISTVAATYHLAIGILYVNNSFHNTIKASSEREISDSLPHYKSWFKFRFATFHI